MYNVVKIPIEITPEGIHISHSEQMGQHETRIYFSHYNFEIKSSYE